jgi:hypothetical protein
MNRLITLSKIWMKLSIITILMHYLIAARFVETSDKQKKPPTIARLAFSQGRISPLILNNKEVTRSAIYAH